MIKESLKQAAYKFPATYRMYLHRRGFKPKDIPNAPWHNAVLNNDLELAQCDEQVKNLKIMPHYDRTKNWDTLAMLDCILRNTKRDGVILDAGAEMYSSLLQNLFLYGYENLFGLNLEFGKSFNRGPIRYEHGDLTKTRFANESFDAISCQSVIEHGVDVKDYFREMSRLLKPNGHLITSTDYYVDPIDTLDKQYFGVPVKVFTKSEMVEILDIASQFRLVNDGTPLNLECTEKPIHWIGLNYTFIIFTLRKIA